MQIVMLSKDAIIYLAEAATRADAEGKTLRVAVDGSTFKYKVGEGMWSVPFRDCHDPYRNA